MQVIVDIQTNSFIEIEQIPRQNPIKTPSNQPQTPASSPPAPTTSFPTSTTSPKAYKTRSKIAEIDVKEIRIRNRTNKFNSIDRINKLFRSSSTKLSYSTLLY